ncbi:MAG: hypothetical protein AAB932_05730, partial [Patescibacteria group bacterium]
MIVFSFVDNKPPFEMVDMFVRELIKFKDVYKERAVVRAEGISIPLVSIDHLIRLKKKASRPKDLDDIIQLKHIQRLSRP